MTTDEHDDIVRRLREPAGSQFGKSMILCNEAADLIERLRIGQAVIAKQVGYYKPETPDFEFVRVPLGILRRSLHCVPPPYPEDALMDDQRTEPK